LKSSPCRRIVQNRQVTKSGSDQSRERGIVD
jgi:hypothetical protein